MRNLSEKLKRELLKQNTDEVFLFLIEIYHSSLSEPIRVVNDGVNHTSNGNEYIGLPYELTLPEESADSVPIASLKIDNVDRQIGKTIRSMSGRATVNIKMVLASDPDSVETEWLGLGLEQINYDALQITGELVGPNFLIEQFPGDSFTPDKFPALF